MPLQARAFLGIWHNLEPGTERDFDRWHTYEHMLPEVVFHVLLEPQRGLGEHILTNDEN